MRKIDYDGLLMCRIQGKIFEKSLIYLNCSSPVFIKKYMYSDDARCMDVFNFLNTSKSDIQVLEDIKDNEFGKIKYTKDELYWIGYLYRYFCYTYELSSKYVFRKINGTTLKDLYYTYHTLDPANAIERIIDDYSINIHDENSLLINTQYIIKEKIEKATL